MKMTWKKKNTSDTKTRKRPIPLNPNLPFEDLNSSFDSNEEGVSLGNDVVTDKKTSLSDEEAGKLKNLAHDFEAQGNKLVEYLFKSRSGGRNQSIEARKNLTSYCSLYSPEMGQKRRETLIYALVARGTPPVVLAEYTEFSGNFTSIAYQFLQKLPSSNNKFTYNCDSHTFNYLVHDGFSWR